MPSCLMITDGLGNVKKVELEKPLYTLGRQADNDIQLLGASVSRRHAEIVLEGNEYFLVDCESKGGCFVNADKVVRHRLRHGDRIQLGTNREHEIQFLDRRIRGEADSAPQPSNPASSPVSNARAELQNLARFLEVNQALKISLPIDEVLRLIVDAAIEITHAERGALMLREDGGQLEFRVARDHERRTLTIAEFPVSRTVLDRVYRECRSLILAGSGDDAPVGSESVIRLDLRTIVCIPLIRFQMLERSEATGMHMRESVGVLYVDSRHAVGTLTRTSVTLLESLAFEASKALESIRLIQQEEEKQRIEQELATARGVQDALLSTSQIESEYAEISANSIPCRFVGGDFFDMFPMDRDRMAFVLGDVSGKGIPAALLAAMAQGVLNALIRSGKSLAAVADNLNQLLLSKSFSGRFITLFCGTLDHEGKLVFVNAGHNPPMLLHRTGELELLLSDSMVVGAWAPAIYADIETKLLPGDVLIAYTDGVTEARAPSGEMFGNERLERCIRSAADLDAAEIRQRLLAEVACFTQEAPQRDDITVVVIKMKG